MTDYYTPRAMTSPELALFRANQQSSQIYMAIHNPATVYTAMVNQTFSSLDEVVQVTYDTGSGTLADVLPGMTMYVGSAAGLSDLGMCRIRQTPTSSIFYVGENADIFWADNVYLTIVDDFAPWARHLWIANKVPYMDYNIAYTDQHTNTTPIPVLGPRYVPVWMTGSSVTVHFDASLSYCLPDTSISGFVWTFPGSTSSAGTGTATPTATYNAAGTYRAACQVQAANGNYTNAYVYVCVFTSATPPITQFDLKSCSGSYTDGGWQFSVTMWDQASLPTVRDRAKVVLFAKDYYGTTEQEMGQIQYRENIIAEGWIDGESPVCRLHMWIRRPAGSPADV